MGVAVAVRTDEELTTIVNSFAKIPACTVDGCVQYLGRRLLKNPFPKTQTGFYAGGL
jgi:hypothetical protein